VLKRDVKLQLTNLVHVDNVSRLVNTKRLVTKPRLKAFPNKLSKWALIPIGYCPAKDGRAWVITDNTVIVNDRYPIKRPLFQVNLGKPAPERLNQSVFERSKRWWSGSGISWTICKSFAARSSQILDNHASVSSLNFLQAGCSSWHPANSTEDVTVIVNITCEHHVEPLTLHLCK